MRPFSILALIICTACGANRSATQYGTTTVNELILEKGQPLSVETIPIQNGKILLYPNNEKYQINGDIVVNGFKDPVNDQKLLIYWKHAFKDCQTKSKKVEKDYERHEFPEFYLTCESEGLSVYYTEGSEYVSRIVEYAKK